MIQKTILEEKTNVTLRNLELSILSIQPYARRNTSTITT